MYVTDGAHDASAFENGFVDRRHYASARRAELVDALSTIGIPISALLEVGLEDMTAYKHLDLLVAKIVQILERNRADLVITHAFEGGHPDHDSVALATVLACSLIVKSLTVLEFPLYSKGVAGRIY